MADISAKSHVFFRDHPEFLSVQGNFKNQAELNTYAQRRGIILPPNAGDFLIAQQAESKENAIEVPEEGHSEGIHYHRENEPAHRPRGNIGQTYENAIRNTVDDWNTANRNNPDAQFKGDVFVWKDGKYIINPDAVKKIPDLPQHGERMTQAIHGEQEIRRYRRWAAMNDEERTAAIKGEEEERNRRVTNPKELKETITDRVKTASQQQAEQLEAVDRQQNITRPGGKKWYEGQIDQAKLTKTAQQQSVGQFLRQNKNNGRAIREALRDPELRPLIDVYREQEKEMQRRMRENARFRSLHSPQNDPRLQQLKSSVGSATEKAQEQQAYEKFVRQNPNQARRYARRDPNIKAAYGRVRAQDALARKRWEEAQKLTKKRGLLGRAWRRVRPIKRVYLPLPGQSVPEAVIPSRWQRLTGERFSRFGRRFDPIRNRYDDLLDWRDRVYDKYSPTRFIPRGYEKLKDRFQQTRLGRWLKSKRDGYLERMDRLAAWRDRMNERFNPYTRAKRRFQNSNFYKNTFGRYNKFKSRLSELNQRFNPYEIAKKWLRNLRRQIANAIKNAIKNAFRALGRGIAQGARFMAPILGRALKNLGSAAARGARRLAGRAVGSAANAMSKMAAEVARMAAQMIAQAGIRVVGAALAPYALVIGGVILLIFIIVFAIISEDEETPPVIAPPPTVASVTIDKNAEKEAVANDEVIRYTIVVKPQGAAEDFKVFDDLPDNATVENASPEPTEQTDTTLVWSLKALQGGTGTSPAPSPPPGDASPFQPDPNAQGTIHNLGFGPSDANRIENMIRSQFPKSPLLGYGSEIIEFAKEFNMDPLMVVLMKTESQFCTDTGVGSPGGSNPDNFNCGNIKWGAAEHQVDTKRWNAQSGPTDQIGNVFTYVPSERDGIGLFFDYISADFYRGKDLYEFYNIYNDCKESAPLGFACGNEAVDSMLQYLRDNAGTPASGSSVAASGTEFKPLTITLTLKPILKPNETGTYVVNKVRAEVVGGTTAP